MIDASSPLPIPLPSTFMDKSGPSGLSQCTVPTIQQQSDIAVDHLTKLERINQLLAEAAQLQEEVFRQ